MHLMWKIMRTSWERIRWKLSGKISPIIGEFMTEKEVKEGRAHLVIVADDASDNTKKKFQNMCDFYKVPIYFFEDKDTLGHAMGKEFRASLAVTDAGFATSGYGRRIIGTVYRR